MLSEWIVARMASGSGSGDSPRVIIVSKVLLNPYVRLLYDSVGAAGIQCQLDRDFGFPWLRAHRGLVDVVHIHWLEMLYLYPRFKQRLRRTLSVVAAILFARVWGIRLVYTVHNLSPHEQSHPAWASLANWFIFRFADAIHVHDAMMAAQVTRRYGREHDIHVIAHGNYIGAYPDGCTRAEAREWLGIDPNVLVYLFLGQLRRYKGIEALLDAYEAIRDVASVLLIAGRARDESYGREVEAAVAGRAGVRLHLGVVPDNEVQYYMGAADVCVFPYQHVTTSGAAVLAFSFGVPVIAPSLGCFVDLVGDQRGILYDTARAAALGEALGMVREQDLRTMGQAASAYARALDWAGIGRQHAGLYRDLVSRA